MRKSWIIYLEKIVFPVLSAAATDCLKDRMPIYENRNKSQYLEAVGRVICGIAPWLNLPIDDTEESKLREKYKILTVKSISNLVNINARDYVDFSSSGQALVDTAYLVQGMLRAPNLWEALGENVQSKLIFEVKKTRQFKPSKNNWLLFASMVEIFLLEYNNECNKKRLYFGVKKFIKNFYIGDGLYGDGELFSMDYYNSFVIHPMLVDILKYMNKHGLKKARKYETKQILRFKRYAEIQERMISPEGAYPIFGRTLICRFGTFHALAQAALLQLLPDTVSLSQVRCGLNAVLKRHMECLANFDSKGFLTIGFNGKQEDMAENYVSSGSPYHCTSIFLPLGLVSQHPFWINKDSEWTSLKAFKGFEFNADHTFLERNLTKERIMSIVYKFQSLFFKIKNVIKLK